MIIIIFDDNLIYFSFVQDNNGSIENEELRGFLKDLLELVKKVCFLIFFQKNYKFKKLNIQDYDAQDLSDIEDTILRGVGYDKDGKVSRKELTMILLTLSKVNVEEE